MTTRGSQRFVETIEGQVVTRDYGIYESRSAEVPLDKLLLNLGSFFDAFFGPRRTPVERLLELRRDLEAKGCREEVAIIDRSFRSPMSDRDARTALELIGLGRRTEMSHVLPFQKYALLGKQPERQCRENSKSRRLTNEAHRKRYRAVSAELSAQSRRGEPLHKEKAYRAVADALGLDSSSTVKKSYFKVCKMDAMGNHGRHSPNAKQPE